MLSHASSSRDTDLSVPHISKKRIKDLNRDKTELINEPFVLANPLPLPRLHTSWLRDITSQEEQAG